MSPFHVTVPLMGSWARTLANGPATITQAVMTARVSLTERVIAARLSLSRPLEPG